MRLRPTREDLDDHIVDAAAGLMAQHGARRTTVQAVADTVGYSKAAVLHRFTNKEGLQQAVAARCAAHSAEVLTSVADLPAGPVRDRAVLAALSGLLPHRLGLVALMVACVVGRRSADLDAMRPVRQDLLAAFALDPTPPTDHRFVAVVGALGALVVTSAALQALHPEGVEPAVTALVLEISTGALGGVADAAR